MNSYDFAQKDRYRARVWGEIEKICATPKWLRRVVYLDTREALETRFLLSRGYNPENLLAVNREPVEVALLTAELKRHGLPTVKTAGVEWVRAIRERLHPNGAHILNFDGMGCVSKHLVNLLRESISASRATVVAVNMLGGREGPIERQLVLQASGQKSTSFGYGANGRHHERIVLTWQVASCPEEGAHECLFHVTGLSWDVYRSSSGQPMVWSVAAVEPHGPISSNHLRVARKHGIAPWCAMRAVMKLPVVQKQVLEVFAGASHD